MKKYALLALCLCGFWLLIWSWGRSGARLKQLRPLIITSPIMPQAVLKESYGGRSGFAVTAAGGIAPYRWTWAAADGSTLPPGLKLRSDPDGTGTILGTPTNNGPYGVIVTVTDSESPAAQTSETYIITVAATSLDLVLPNRNTEYLRRWRATIALAE